MNYNYNLLWLTDKFDRGENLKYLFFGGHSNSLNEPVGKFCLSQWFELPFLLDGVTYNTAEHWMMANKALLFNDTATYLKVINAKTPGEAKELGRQVIGFDEVLWRAKRYDIVVKGNIHKFNQHPAFADFLINTKERILVEASPIDKIWGIGLAKDAERIDNPYFWNGQNLLGFALMEVRDFLKSFGSFKYNEYPMPLPWRDFPKIDPHDMFWRMGKGEDMISKFAQYFDKLSVHDQTIFKLVNPTPHNWSHFYDD